MFAILKVSMAMKMATVERAVELLEKLRNASWDAAVKGTIFFDNASGVMKSMNHVDFFLSPVSGLVAGLGFSHYILLL